MIVLVGESANREATAEELRAYDSLMPGTEAWVRYQLSEGAFACGCRYAELGLRWDDSMNLMLPGAKWYKHTAEKTANAVLRYVPADLFILAGRRVSSAFGLKLDLPALDGRFLCLPHPSGRCRAWNNRRVERLIQECWNRAKPLSRNDELLRLA